MISIIELTPDLLKVNVESYKQTLSALRPSDDATYELLLASFLEMKQQGSFVFVALDEDVGLIGSLTLLVEHKMLRNGVKAGHLEDMCIHPEYQGKGLGSQLVEKALAHAKEVGCYKVILDASESLVGRYERFGFESDEVMMRTYL